MQIKDNTLLFRVLSILLYVVLVVFVLVKGAAYLPDSHSFLNMDFHRSIGYNSFLKVFTSLFNESFGIPLILTQAALLILVSRYLVKAIRNLFDLPDYWTLILQLIVLAPAFYLHYVANTILSEGLTYPLFLLFVAFTIKGFVLTSKRHYYYAVLILFALLMTRGQFIAMVPVLIVLIALEGFQSKFNKQTLFLLGVVVLVPFVSGLVEKTYNRAVYGHFEKTPFSNVSLISPAFYVSDASDHEIFKNEQQQQFFKQVYQRLDSLGLSKEKVALSDSESYTLFHAKYSKICNLSIHETGTEYYASQGFDKEQQLIAVNDLSGQMVLPLIKDNFKDWLRLYLDNLKNAFGSGKQLLLFLMLLITAFIFVLKKRGRLAKFIFAAVLVLFANMTIVPLAVHSIKRYLFYTDWMIFAIVILLLSKVFIKKEITE